MFLALRVRFLFLCMRVSGYVHELRVNFVKKGVELLLSLIQALHCFLEQCFFISDDLEFKEQLCIQIFVRLILYKFDS